MALAAILRTLLRRDSQDAPVVASAAYTFYARRRTQSFSVQRRQTDFSARRRQTTFYAPRERD